MRVQGKPHIRWVLSFWICGNGHYPAGKVTTGTGTTPSEAYLQYKAAL